MEAQLLQQQQTIKQLQAQMQTEHQRNELFERMTGAIKQLTSRIKTTAQLVDTRGVGKPSTFGVGDERTLEKQFLVWSRKMQNFVVSVFPDMKPVLEWAGIQSEAITADGLEAAFGSQADDLDTVEDVANKNHQFYSVLVQLTEGDGTDLVCNSRDNGLEAWRKWTRRYDPLTGGWIRNLLRFIINPGR